MTLPPSHLLGEAHSDAFGVVRPELLDQAIVQLEGPLARQERLDLCPAGEESGAVPPDAAGRIGEHDARRIAAVPAILGGAHLCAALSAVNGGSGGRIS